MVQITFVEHNGNKHNIKTREGISLMEAAKANGIEGILANCGGACACATCHVFIDADWKNKVSKISNQEDAMLEFSMIERSSRSRLSCQILITPELDGLIVHIPESQF